MTTKPTTWMPMYWGSYFKKTGALSTVEHGAYMLLIGNYWTSGSAPPDDDERLARLARLPTKQWKAMRATLAVFFNIHDGQWFHDRVEKELAIALANVEAKALAGAKGAAKRWQAHGSRIAEPSVRQWQTGAPSPTPSPSPSESNPPPPSGAPPRARRIGTHLPDDWSPTLDQRRAAMARGFEPDQVGDMAESFRAYWTVGNGRNKTHADWNAAWRVWVSKEKPKGPTNGSRPGRTELRRASLELAADLTAEDAARIEDHRADRIDAALPGQPAIPGGVEGQAPRLPGRPGTLPSGDGRAGDSRRPETLEVLSEHPRDSGTDARGPERRGRNGRDGDAGLGSLQSLAAINGAAIVSAVLPGATSVLAFTDTRPGNGPAGDTEDEGLDLPAFLRRVQ